ncbi:hypothetical protein [Microbacterium sp. NPDC080220]|uniref:hypothetical protein n=1 Tax=Microbacterium sp. NPDC080220 TaxID=3161017 RepID=UPI003430B982
MTHPGQLYVNATGALFTLDEHGQRHPYTGPLDLKHLDLPASARETTSNEDDPSAASRIEQAIAAVEATYPGVYEDDSLEIWTARNGSEPYGSLTIREFITLIINATS